MEKPVTIDTSCKACRDWRGIKRYINMVYTQYYFNSGVLVAEQSSIACH